MLRKGGRDSAHVGRRLSPGILILQAGKDELVPAGQASDLETSAKEAGLGVARIEIQGALHNEVATRAAGRAAIVEFLRQTGELEGD